VRRTLTPENRAKRGLARVYFYRCGIPFAAVLCALLGACRTTTTPQAHGLPGVSSSVESDKEIARRFLLAIAAKDAAALGAVLAPDAHLSLVIAGVYSKELHAFPHGTQWDRDSTIKMEINSQKALEGPSSLQILSLVAEGDCVAAEAIEHGVRAANHRQYLQHYSYHFKMSRGQIEDIRLYQDTFHHWDVWDNQGPPAQPPTYRRAGSVDSTPVEQAPPEQVASLVSANASADNVAANKALVRRFLISVPSRDPQASLAAWAPDGVWSFAVGGDYSPALRGFESAPRWKPEQLVNMQLAVLKGIREPMTLDIYSLIGEGSNVSVEAVGFLVRADGHAYRQHYSIFFKVRDGKLVEAHEYQDTLHQYDLKLEHSSYAPVTPSSEVNE